MGDAVSDNDFESSLPSFEQPALANIWEDYETPEVVSPELTVPEMDIANLVEKHLPDAEKLDALRKIWAPPKGYKFPLTKTGPGKPILIVPFLIILFNKFKFKFSQRNVVALWHLTRTTFAGSCIQARWMVHIAAIAFCSPSRHLK